MGRKNKNKGRENCAPQQVYESANIFFSFEECSPHIETFSNLNPLADKTSI